MKGSHPSLPPGEAEIAHAQLTSAVSAKLRRAALPPGPSFPCPYLEGREARYVSLHIEPVEGLYHALLDLNFRRSGSVIYRPDCENCSECRTLRVPVKDFRLSRAQRRCLSANHDLSVEIGPPEETLEKHDLYRRYLEARHDGQMDGSLEEFQGALYRSPLNTLEVVYRLGGRVVGVGILDKEPLAWSAVYCYYEPALAPRSLGVFNILTLIEQCQRRDVPHLYLGYYVRTCRTMAYKASYRPCELLEESGQFARLYRDRPTS